MRFFLFFVCAPFWLLHPEAATAAPALVPPDSAYPAPFWLLKLCLILLFFIHIVLVNVTIGMTALSFCRIRRHGGAAALSADAAPIPKALALAINFGVAAYLFLQVLYGRFVYPTGVLIAVWWVAAPLFLIFAYYALYIAYEAPPEGRRSSRLLVGLTLALFFAVAGVFVTNATLMLKPGDWAGWLEAPYGMMTHVAEPSFAPRYLHIVFASLAVGGLALALKAEWASGRAPATDSGALADLDSGLRWFTRATLAQMAAGIWFLFSLPEPVRELFLGGGLLHATTLLLAVTGACSALYFAHKRKPKQAAAATLGVILVMVAARDLLREAMLLPYTQGLHPTPEALAGHGASSVLPVMLPQGQTAAFLLFLGCCLLAAALAVWIARVSVRAFARPATTDRAPERPDGA